MAIKCLRGLVPGNIGMSARFYIGRAVGLVEDFADETVTAVSQRQEVVEQLAEERIRIGGAQVLLLRIADAFQLVVFGKSRNGTRFATRLFPPLCHHPSKNARILLSYALLLHGWALLPERLIYLYGSSI